MIKKLINNNLPELYLKIKKSTMILADTICIILLGMGYSENSLIMLILRVGLSGLFTAIEIFFTDAKN